MSLILGLNAYHADASAALLKDGELVCAIEEERLNRKKHCAGFPSLAVKACLAEVGARLADVDEVAISRDPGANLFKKVLFTLQKRPNITKLLKDRIGNAARVRNVDEALLAAVGEPAGALRRPVRNVEHHHAHMASAFYCSPFEGAAILSIDGFGDFVSTMWGKGRGTAIETLGEVAFPHSLGILYTAVTQWLGFPKYGDEGKVMGLAPYGKPRYMDRFAQIVRLVPDGAFELDLGYFRHHSEGVEMTWDEGSPTLGRCFSDKLVELFGPPREPGGPYTDHVHDVAASLQKTLEEAIFHVLRMLHQRTGLTRLGLAGGVALNSVTNGKIFDNTPFREVFIQAAAGDNGTSLGAALWAEHAVAQRPRRWVMDHAYTGPQFDDAQIEKALAAVPRGDHSVRKLTAEELVESTAAAVADGKVVGWFQGRMEFGPRALGNRSIVADPRRAEMKDILNKRIKHREAFRPFAPSVLEEHTAEYFTRSEASPTMLLVFDVRPEKRSVVPAITHVDGTGRLQTVSKKTNPLYHQLISAFALKTGVHLVLNTSFNEDEPIVCTPEDGINCYLKTKMDVLAIGSFMIERKG